MRIHMYISLGTHHFSFTSLSTPHRTALHIFCLSAFSHVAPARALHKCIGSLSCFHASGDRFVSSRVLRAWTSPSLLLAAIGRGVFLVPCEGGDDWSGIRGWPMMQQSMSRQDVTPPWNDSLSEQPWMSTLHGRQRPRHILS
jgi:hypothetical protein